ncbi:MAG TPA: bifunctional enoyl-CoA hydratase/phosphate acetyltransferase, partial [Nitrospira sp.]
MMTGTTENAERRGTGKYEALLAHCKDMKAVATAVAHPCDDASLSAVVEAARAGIITPILVGPSEKIRRTAKESELDIAPYEIVDVPHSHAAAAGAVELVRVGRAQLLMKGSLHTDELMSEVVKRDTGLRTARRISHVFVMDVPTYHKVFAITDAAINIFPGLEDKVDILQNAIDFFVALGQKRPKVAILSAVETINPKIPSTVEAAALCKMADR